MTNQHRATDEQWAQIEELAPGPGQLTCPCLLELRDRIQQLESAQQVPDPYAGRPSSLTDDERKATEDAAEAGARCAIEQLRSKPGSWRPTEPAPSPRPSTLVDRVANAIYNVPFDSDAKAGAAIREVAAWLLTDSPVAGGNAAAWASLLERESSR